MKSKRYRLWVKILSVVIGLVLSIPLATGGYRHFLHIGDNTEVKPALSVGERSAPNFYKVIGKAVVLRQVPVGTVQYDKFDSQGRTLGVYAHLNRKNFDYGKRPRADISGIKPSGWVHNRKVEMRYADGTVYHGWFYNRSHLLAHSLGGDDADYNMITGTRPQNVGSNRGGGGMQFTETEAYNYLKSKPNGSVYYSAVPNYEGNEKLPRSVTVDIKSDDGTIDQKVLVLNTAPGYRIDYATGLFEQN